MSLDSALGAAVDEVAVDEIAGLLNTRIGLRPEPTLRGRLRRSIRDEALAHGHDPQTYVSILRSQQDALQRLLNRVTVQETGFFRHPEHFEVLARDVLPGWQAIVVTVSAGCVVEPDASTDELLSTADSRLYDAKHAGRNLVVASGGPDSDAN